jgi:hypothetical protein
VPTIYRRMRFLMVGTLSLCPPFCNGPRLVNPFA